MNIYDRSLHKSCPILIGLYFLCQTLGAITTFIPFAIIILPSSILDSLTMQTCSAINFLPATANFGIYTLTFVISLDRLISVYFPLWFVGMNKNIFKFDILLFKVFNAKFFKIVFFTAGNFDWIPSNLCIRLCYSKWNKIWESVIIYSSSKHLIIL